MSAHASCGDALGVIRHAAGAVDDSSGSAPATAQSHRLGSLDLPQREPLRWLHAPPAAQLAAPQDGEYVYVTLPPEARAKMDGGASFQFSGMHSDAPQLLFPDGTRFVGAWDTSVGTTMVFQDDDGSEGGGAAGGEGGAQQQQAQQQQPRLVGTTETLLTFRPAPPLGLPAPAGGTATEQV